MRRLDIKDIFSIVVRQKLLLILILVFCVILGFFYSTRSVKPEYKSSSKMILTNNIIENNSLSFENRNEIKKTENSINSKLFSTYSNLIKSNNLIEKVKSNLNIDMNVNVLKEGITVNKIDDAGLMEIVVSNSDSKLASQIVNEITNVFSKEIREIYDIKVYIIDYGVAQEVPSNIKNMRIEHIRNITAFVMLGIITCILYIILIIKLDKKIKTEDYIEKEMGLKVLISIPTIKENKTNPLKLINLEGKKNIISEMFKTLRINLQFTNVNSKEKKIILVTSALFSEGKTCITANLAISYAQAGKKVVLIDGDMREGKLATIFNIPSDLGLSNYLANLDTNGMETNERINGYIKETSIKNLNIITSGNIPPNPSELLETNKLYELIKDLSVFYDLIIFDGPPVFPTSDALILSRFTNSIILVCSYNKTKKDELMKVKRDIQNVGGRIIGVVFNKVKIKEQKMKHKILSKENNIKIQQEEPAGGASNLRVAHIKTIFKSNIYIIKNKVLEILKNLKKDEIKLLAAEAKTDDSKQYENPKEITENFEGNKNQKSIAFCGKIRNCLKEYLKKILYNLKEKVEQEELVKIKEAERIIKLQQDAKKEEEKQKEKQEKERLKNEQKLKKESLRLELKNKKLLEKETKRKIKTENKLKQKEEARIKEELLEDNLYPKTKYNKSL